MAAHRSNETQDQRLRKLSEFAPSPSQMFSWGSSAALLRSSSRSNQRSLPVFRSVGTMVNGSTVVALQAIPDSIERSMVGNRTTRKLHNSPAGIPNALLGPRRTLSADWGCSSHTNSSALSGLSSNENKMSDGGRGRASLGVEVWKSSQKWSVQRSAVRSIAWLDLIWL